MQIKIYLFVYFCTFLFACKTVPIGSNRVLNGTSMSIQFFKDKSCIMVFTQERNLCKAAYFAMQATYKVKRKSPSRWTITFNAVQAEKDYLEQLKTTDSVEYAYRKNLLPNNLEADYFPKVNKYPMPKNYKKRKIFVIYKKGYLVIKNPTFNDYLFPYDCGQKKRPCQYKPYCQQDIELFHRMSLTPDGWDNYYGLSFDKLLRTTPDISDRNRYKWCEEGNSKELIGCD